MCYPLGEVLSVIQIAYTGPWIAFVLDAIIRDRLMFWRIKTGKWATIKL
jgi:Na+-driven multidrug efflux pump